MDRLQESDLNLLSFCVYKFTIQMELRAERVNSLLEYQLGRSSSDLVGSK
jgi:hypothetical protein